MSLRLSACSTMPCQLFSSEVFSSEVLGEVRCSATAILFSRVSRRCFVRDMSEHDLNGKPVPTPHQVRGRLFRIMHRGRLVVAPKLDATSGIVNMPRRYCGLRAVAVRPSCRHATM